MTEAILAKYRRAIAGMTGTPHNSVPVAIPDLEAMLDVLQKDAWTRLPRPRVKTRLLETELME